MQDIFAGTRYDPRFRVAIQKDMTSATEFFPGMKLERVMTAQYPYLQMSGTIPIVYQGTDIEIPLYVILPDQFPNCPPIVQIPIPQGFHLGNVPNLLPNGQFQVGFIQYIPKQTLMPHFLDAISRYLSSYPPVTPQGAQYLLQMYRQQKQIQQQQQQYYQHTPPSSGSQMNMNMPYNMNQCYSLLQTEADNIIKEANKAQNDLYSSELEVALYNNLDDILSTKLNEVNKKNNALRTTLSGSGEFPIPPDIQEEALSTSKEKASLETIQYLHTALKEQKITPQQFLDMTRRMSRQHFKEYVFPRLL
ncbi:Ubiquitin-conjugating protein [Histomonas meleagridis]|uniref:Ubiquitin-conjugating protein n=1 Tax=Histomonas meleagridis TaxID=135588 RepID=UPI00355AB3E1|nr:Ubiquitin-conjugating protein [Histomonas meleagridis]KAH0804573.1 Ubiquitin-conjugating protein [Histomonas meleagridis]